MTSYVTPKKNVAFKFYVALVDQSNTKLTKANPTIASGDFKVSTDGGAFANLATLPSANPASGRAVMIDLSAGEMNGDNIVVQCVDAAGAEWCDLILNIQTTARQIDDLAFPATTGRSMVVDANGLVDANAVKVGPTGSGTAQTAGDIKATLGTPAGASLAADLAEIEAETDGIAAIPTSTPLTAAQIATGVWQDATAGDFTVANSIGKALYIANIVPGGAGGHLISGANAGTTTLGALTITGAFAVSDGFTVTRSTGNSSAVAFIGTGTGNGFVCLSGTGATGDGFQAAALSTNGNGISAVGVGTGSGLAGFGGNNGGAGLYGGGGTSGDGMKLALGAGGVDFRAAQTGNLTGNVSGSVGSVTSRVTANADQLNGDAVSAANIAKTTRAIGRGTVSGVPTTTSIPTSAFTPAGVDADQFKDRVITFDADTATTALRGQCAQITANTGAATPTFTVTALTRAPAVGDTFSVT